MKFRKSITFRSLDLRSIDRIIDVLKNARTAGVVSSDSVVDKSEDVIFYEPRRGYVPAFTVMLVPTKRTQSASGQELSIPATALSTTWISNLDTELAVDGTVDRDHTSGDVFAISEGTDGLSDRSGRGRRDYRLFLKITDEQVLRDALQKLYDAPAGSWDELEVVVSASLNLDSGEEHYTDSPSKYELEQEARRTDLVLARFEESRDYFGSYHGRPVSIDADGYTYFTQILDSVAGSIPDNVEVPGRGRDVAILSDHLVEDGFNPDKALHTSLQGELFLNFGTGALTSDRLALEIVTTRNFTNTNGSTTHEIVTRRIVEDTAIRTTSTQLTVNLSQLSNLITLSDEDKVRLRPFRGAEHRLSVSLRFAIVPATNPFINLNSNTKTIHLHSGEFNDIGYTEYQLGLNEEALVFEVVGPEGPPGPPGGPGPAGLIWRGDYSNTESYALNDAVALNGTSYRATQAVAPGEVAPDPSGINSHWAIVALKGRDGQPGTPGRDGGTVRWRGEWNAGTAYAQFDAVSFDGSSYVVTTETPAGISPTDTGHYQLLAHKGADGARGQDGQDGEDGSFINRYRGVWDQQQSYDRGSIVENEGSSWVSKRLINQGSAAPAAGDDWALVAERGATGRQGPPGRPGTGGGGTVSNIAKALAHRSLQVSSDIEVVGDTERWATPARGDLDIIQFQAQNATAQAPVYGGTYHTVLTGTTGRKVLLIRVDRVRAGDVRQWGIGITTHQGQSDEASIRVPLQALGDPYHRTEQEGSIPAYDFYVLKNDDTATQRIQALDFTDISGIQALKIEAGTDRTHTSRYHGALSGTRIGDELSISSAVAGQRATVNVTAGSVTRSTSFNLPSGGNSVVNVVDEELALTSRIAEQQLASSSNKFHPTQFVPIHPVEKNVNGNYTSDINERFMLLYGRPQNKQNIDNSGNREFIKVVRYTDDDLNNVKVEGFDGDKIRSWSDQNGFGRLASYFTSKNGSQFGSGGKSDPGGQFTQRTGWATWTRANNPNLRSAGSGTTTPYRGYIGQRSTGANQRDPWHSRLASGKTNSPFYRHGLESLRDTIWQGTREEAAYTMAVGILGTTTVYKDTLFGESEVDRRYTHCLVSTTYPGERGNLGEPWDLRLTDIDNVFNPITWKVEDLESHHSKGLYPSPLNLVSFSWDNDADGGGGVNARDEFIIDARELARSGHTVGVHAADHLHQLRKGIGAASYNKQIINLDERFCVMMEHYPFAKVSDNDLPSRITASTQVGDSNKRGADYKDERGAAIAYIEDRISLTPISVRGKTLNGITHPTNNGDGQTNLDLAFKPGLNSAYNPQENAPATYVHDEYQVGTSRHLTPTNGLEPREVPERQDNGVVGFDKVNKHDRVAAVKLQVDSSTADTTKYRMAIIRFHRSSNEELQTGESDADRTREVRGANNDAKAADNRRWRVINGLTKHPTRNLVGFDNYVDGDIKYFDVSYIDINPDVVSETYEESIDVRTGTKTITSKEFHTYDSSGNVPQDGDKVSGKMFSKEARRIAFIDEDLDDERPLYGVAEGPDNIPNSFVVLYGGTDNTVRAAIVRLNINPKTATSEGDTSDWRPEVSHPGDEVDLFDLGVVATLSHSDFFDGVFKFNVRDGLTTYTAAFQDSSGHHQALTFKIGGGENITQLHRVVTQERYDALSAAGDLNPATVYFIPEEG